MLLETVEHETKCCQNQSTLDHFTGEREQQEMGYNSKGCISLGFTSALTEIFVRFYLKQIITYLSPFLLLIYFLFMQPLR